MLTIFLVFGVFFHSAWADLVVQTKNGKVSGITYTTPTGARFNAWKGIPYAKPPLKELRFLPPVKAEPWNDILDASKCSPSCIYFGVFETDPPPQYGQSENCLFLNVYSPANVSSSRNSSLPVMVWIHGGAFYTGNGGFDFYDPAPLLAENVLVVTLNYRLGALGFLSTEDNIISGNAGLKDQNLALLWVKENIASFGGNPQDVTIFGESAGGMSVGYHLASPMSRGLFKRAIMQSGMTIMHFLQSNAKNTAYNLASQVDSSITTQSTTEQVRNVLQKIDVDLLLNITGYRIIGPVLEANPESSFMSGPLYEAVEAGNIARVPVLIGHNSEESIAFGLDTSNLTRTALDYDSHPENLTPGMQLKDNVTKATVGKLIQQEYAENGLFVNNLSRLLKWSSDNAFGRSTLQQALLQSKFAPVYIYQFSYCGLKCQKENPNIPGAGRVGHAQEVPYLFNMSVNVLKSEEEYLTRSRFVKLWTNFAKYSNPTPDDDSAELLQNVKLKAVSKNIVNFIDIDKDLKIRPSDLKKAAFWAHIWETYSYRPYVTY